MPAKKQKQKMVVHFGYDMYDGSMLEDLQTIRMTILVSAVGDIL
jgi:hypothetical protein